MAGATADMRRGLTQGAQMRLDGYYNDDDVPKPPVVPIYHLP